MTQRSPSYPRVAVVVATYNRAAQLHRLLGALAGQVLDGRFEIVVVDDGSTDDSSAVVHELPGEPHYQVKLLRLETNGGAARARNAGWRAASAPLIAFTDDDCMPVPNWLAAMVTALEASDVAVGRTRPPAEQLSAVGPFSRYLDIGHNQTYSTCNVAYRRRALEAVGGFDDVEFFLHNGEDTDLGLRVTGAGFSATYQPDALVWHDVHPSSFRAHLRGLRHYEGLVALVARHPKARQHVGGRIFLRSVDRAVLVAWLAAPLGIIVRDGRARAFGAAAVSAYYVRHFRRSYYRPRSLSEWLTAVPLAFFADNVALGVMLRASVRRRTLLL